MASIEVLDGNVRTERGHHHLQAFDRTSLVLHGATKKDWDGDVVSLLRDG